MTAEITSAVAKIFLTILLFPIGIWFYAYTVSTIWGWYIVTHFHVAPLPLAIAWGIATLMKFMSLNIADMHFLYHKNSSESEHAYLEKTFIGLCYTALVLFCAWVGTFFI